MIPSLIVGEQKCIPLFESLNYTHSLSADKTQMVNGNDGCTRKTGGLGKRGCPLPLLPNKSLVLVVIHYEDLHKIAALLSSNNPKCY